MTDQFNFQKADINIFDATKDENNSIDAAEKSGKRTVLLGGTEFEVKEVPSIMSKGILINNIQSYNRQKLSNGMVIKFVENGHEFMESDGYEYNNVFYGVIIF